LVTVRAAREGTSKGASDRKREIKWWKIGVRAQDCNMTPFLEWSLPHDLG